MAEVFSQEWREEHAAAGDQALGIARQVADTETGHTITLAAVASAFAAIAQAHYAAANVRARPAGAALRLAERNVLDAAEALVGDWDAERGTTGAILRGAIYDLQRQRATPGPAELSTKTPYVIAGVEGVWQIRAMKTENMGASGDVELTLKRYAG